MTKPRESGFPATRWSLLRQDPNHNQKEELCQLYWRPVFQHLLQRGYPREDAEDLTQSFFLRLLKDQTFAAADRKKGKLRTFLLKALEFHLVDHHRSRKAQKRGGQVEHLPIAFTEEDIHESETSFAHPIDSNTTPEQQFDRAWALDLLRRTHLRLETDYQRAGKQKEYLTLRPTLSESETIDLKKAAATLKIKPASVRVLIHRLRQNFRAALHEETAATLGSHTEVDEELAYFLTLL